MIIRDYKEEDEQEWLRCRVVSFLDCSYYDDVKLEKEKYPNPSVCLVAEEEGKIVGLIDVELDSADLACNQGERGAIVWHMAVLPEYRRLGIARMLWNQAKERVMQQGIRYVELWTQEDLAANRFYQSIGFQLVESQTWLRCCCKWSNCKNYLDQKALGNIYGVEKLVFQAPYERKEELKPICDHIDEVRLYSICL